MDQYEPQDSSRRRIFDLWPRRSAITPDAARIDVLVDAAFHAAMIFAASLSSSTRRHAVPTCAEQSCGYLRYHNYACAICGYLRRETAPCGMRAHEYGVTGVQSSVCVYCGVSQSILQLSASAWSASQNMHFSVQITQPKAKDARRSCGRRSTSIRPTTARRPHTAASKKEYTSARAHPPTRARLGGRGARGPGALSHAHSKRAE